MHIIHEISGLQGKLTTSYTAASVDREINHWFPVSVLVLNNSDGSVISGARVRIYINGATTTLAAKPGKPGQMAPTPPNIPHGVQSVVRQAHCTK